MDRPKTSLVKEREKEVGGTMGDTDCSRSSLRAPWLLSCLLDKFLGITCFEEDSHEFCFLRLFTELVVLQTPVQVRTTRPLGSFVVLGLSVFPFSSRSASSLAGL